jgi:hypothetical protein
VKSTLRIVGQDNAPGTWTDVYDGERSPKTFPVCAYGCDAEAHLQRNARALMYACAIDDSDPISRDA